MTLSSPCQYIAINNIDVEAFLDSRNQTFRLLLYIAFFRFTTLLWRITRVDRVMPGIVGAATGWTFRTKRRKTWE